MLEGAIEGSRAGGRARAPIALGSSVSFLSFRPLLSSCFMPARTLGSFLIRRSRVRRCIRPAGRVRAVRFPFIRVHPPEVGRRPPCVGETERRRKREKEKERASAESLGGGAQED